MKKYIAGILTGIIITLSITGFAAVKIKSAQYTDNTLTVNGKKINTTMINLVEKQSIFVLDKYNDV